MSFYAGDKSAPNLERTEGIFQVSNFSK